MAVLSVRNGVHVPRTNRTVAAAAPHRRILRGKAAGTDLRGEAFLRTDITPLGDYEFSEDAHAWEIGGTGNSPGTVGLSVALSLILDLGPQHIERHIHTLADHLEDALDRRGLTVVSPPDPRYRSGIVTFSTGHVTADVSLMRSLVAAGVAVSVRFASGARGVRGSCHHYNTIEDVELPLEGIDTWRQ